MTSSSESHGTHDLNFPAPTATQPENGLEVVAARRWDKTYPGGQWLYFTPTDDGEKLVRQSEAAAIITSLREALAIAERNRDAARANFLTMQQAAAVLKQRGDTLQAAIDAIADTDEVDAALDPTRLIRIAGAARRTIRAARQIMEAGGKPS